MRVVAASDEAREMANSRETALVSARTPDKALVKSEIIRKSLRYEKDNLQFRLIWTPEILCECV